MNEKIHELLREFGLKEQEIKIYLYLVGNKELTAYRIAKETGIHRSTTYDILERLIQKGFVNKVEKNQTLFYSANQISKVAATLKDKETLLLSLIPEIEKMEKTCGPQVKVFEGLDGRKQFNYNFFSLAKMNKIKQVYMISSNYSPTIGLSAFMDMIIKYVKTKKLHKKIEYRGVWDSSFREDDLVKKYGKVGENRFLKNLPSKSTTLIYDEYVVFLFASDKPYTIEIKNKLVANEMLSYFNHLWEKADV